jgi:murein L,D-transpeptidase YcbB/YkuD
MVYQTAWVDKNGMLHFSEDVYGRDQKLAEALFVKE